MSVRQVFTVTTISLVLTIASIGPSFALGAGAVNVPIPEMNYPDAGTKGIDRDTRTYGVPNTFQQQRNALGDSKKLDKGKAR